MSHSHALAAAAVGLAAEMVDAEQLPRIEVAAGLDDSSFGTDAAAVAEAIGRADSEDGVLLLLDLGSAVLSAEMALEFLDPEIAGRVCVSSAPLVEGLVAAVVTASGGADVGSVRVEAERGLQAKQQHLDDTEPEVRSEDTAPDEGPGPDALTRQFVVDVPHGLHARPAARLVGRLNGFATTRVLMRNLDGSDRVVDASSLSAVASLGVGQGDRVKVWAEGADAEALLDALVALAEDSFGDEATAAPASRTAVGPTECTGDGADDPAPPLDSVPSMGSGLDAAIGVVQRVDESVDLDRYEGSGDPTAERDRLDAAIAVASRELVELASRTRTHVGPAEAEIFDAHLALVHDRGIGDPARVEIAEGTPAARAWQRAGADVASQFAQLPDEYQRERSQDVRSITDRVLRHLIRSADGGDDTASGGEQRILVVQELDPGTAASLDVEQIAGVLTIGGGSTGHGVLIASARGIPVMTGVARAADFTDGVLVAFDARDGRVLIDPDAAERGDFERMLSERAEQQKADRAAATEPGQTKDGTSVSVKANVTSPAEAAGAVRLGAEGSGLVRTEVMFGGWSTAPTVHEQVAELTAVARALDGGEMTVRTWDIGADKPLPFWAQSPEQNPFLGVRGLRSFRTDPTLLVDQLEAVCQVALEHPVRVMFPMVATVEEVHWALDQLAVAVARRGGARPEGLDVGIMIEVPAAALRAEAMTTQLDFVSIGTNDLTQYTLAAERGNAGVEHLFDPLDPAVLALIAQVCRDVADGVSVGVCGGAASDPAAAALLVGLGVDDLSATPVAVPRVKAALRRHTTEQMQELAERALRCESATEVRALIVAAMS
ncbi:MAG: phosphoenolpyruvate--protein phosphotransferase [Ornithinimicrobium sp.]